MKIARRRFLSLAGAAVASPAVVRVAWGQAPQVTLKMHHFLPPVANGPAKFLTPWARKVEQDSGGKIKIDIFPSMQLGGAPPQLYDQVRDGVVDLIWTLPGYTPGRFPIIETFELPFVASKAAVPNSKAVQEFSQTHLKQEFGEVHVICYWAHDGGLFHATKQIKTLDDLKGLKLRFPTRLAGEGLKSVGVNAIGMPVPQVPEALAQRVLDGAVVPWEVVPALKLHELVKYHTEVPGSPTFYSSTFILAMNKGKYESLPADLKKVIDANSGQGPAAAAGQVWDEQAKVVSEMVAKRGNTISQFSAADVEQFRKATQPVRDAWIKQMKERGQDGGKLIEAAQALIAKYSKAT